MPQSRNGSIFPKIIAILGIIFGISLGLCGVTAVFAGRGGGEAAAGLVGVISLAGMLLSLAGLILVLPIWAIVAAVSRSHDASEETQPTVDSSDQKQ